MISLYAAASQPEWQPTTSIVTSIRSTFAAPAPYSFLPPAAADILFTNAWGVRAMTDSPNFSPSRATAASSNSSYDAAETLQNLQNKAQVRPAPAKSRSAISSAPRDLF